MSYDSATLLLTLKLLYFQQHEGIWAWLIWYPDTTNMAIVPTTMTSTTAINFTTIENHAALLGGSRRRRGDDGGS